MADDPFEPTPEELLSDEAKVAIQTPPERIAAAAGLPDDVRDGNPDSEPGEDDAAIADRPPTTEE